MQRPGQPPQRPPSLGPNPALGGPFRGSPYPQYGMAPRNVNVLQGNFAPNLQPRASATQQQNMLPTPSPGFIQQRNQGNFPFGGIGPTTPGGQPQQPHPSTNPLLQHSNGQQSSQQGSNGASTGLLPHLTQGGPPSVSGTAPSASASEVGLDPNDFPALGSTAPTSSANNGSANVTASYASQAGTTPGLAVSIGNAAMGAAANGPQQRDFTPDDFPALGGQPQQVSSQNQQNQDHAHPPGLNGFDTSAQHRQNLLGSIQQPGTPGLLNIGAQTRNVHPGFQTQTDAERQKTLKPNQASHAAWNSPNANPGIQSQIGSGTFPSTNPVSTISQTNGNHNPITQNPSQNLSNSLPTSQSLLPPPGVALSSNAYNPSSQQSAHAPGTIANAANTSAPSTAPLAPPYMPNGMGLPTPHDPHNHHPQTPAQQVLMSAADRWGLLGLLAMIKNASGEPDGGLSSVGTDLGTMGLDVGYSGNLYSTFITPWADQSAAHSVEPDYHLPACYNVQPPPPGPNKATAFSDETLFFMFYSSPRDALQEVAAQELFNRNWRYHKELRHWITKETGTSPSSKILGGEQGQYTYWEPENWQKERKEMTVVYADLEEKNIPQFLPGPGLIPSHGAPAVNQTLTQAPAQQQALQQRGFQQASIAGL